MTSYDPQASVAERQIALMLNNLSEETYELYRQALHCERQADVQTDPKVKRQFLELKRLWLLLARRRIAGFLPSK
jgi:hypothetical protein